MIAQEKIVRTYDRTMFGSTSRRYYGDTGFYNFGYWAAGATSQGEACIALVDRLIDQIPDRSGRILDVACGMGASTKRLMRDWPPSSITAINISDAQLAKARECAPGCTILKMDATKLDFPDQHFDAVLCVEAAFHFDTRDTFLREAYRVLKPGGRLILSDILFRSTTWLVADSLGVPRANLVSSIEGYRRCVEAAGFAAIDIEDATSDSLVAFQRNLRQWSRSKGNAGQAPFLHRLRVSLTGQAIAAYFGLTSKTYLLVAATKPAA